MTDCFCAQSIVGTIPCDGCASSADCAALLPGNPGPFCIVDTNGVCNCQAGQSRCFVPCPV